MNRMGGAGFCFFPLPYMATLVRPFRLARKGENKRAKVQKWPHSKMAASFYRGAILVRIRAAAFVVH